MIFRRAVRQDLKTATVSITVGIFHFSAGVTYGARRQPGT